MNRLDIAILVLWILVGLLLILTLFSFKAPRVTGPLPTQSLEFQLKK